MSKPFRYFCLVSLLTSALQISAGAGIRDPTPPYLTVSVRVVYIDGKPMAHVSGRFTERRRPEFRKAFSLSHLTGRRPLQVQFSNYDGKQMGFQELSEGEYLAEDEIRSWSYVIDLSPVADRRASAHASWISGEIGLLMMRDLWPRIETANDHALLNLRLPEGWSLSVDKLPDGSVTPLPGLSAADGWFAGASTESVFVIGKHWREREIHAAPTIKLILSGEWHFTDAEAADMVRQVHGEYERLLGRSVYGSVSVTLTKFPVSASPGSWEAETRGNNVTIISSDMPFKTQSLQRLHEQLRHELFHLWIPNGVNLTGNYDWFYEGFALYQSLKLAVGLNRIRFEDFLDTLSRAHSIDSAQSQSMSLIQASATRFSGANTQVYARGMLVAFLCDLAMLQKSRGKRSVENLVRDLFEKHRKPNAASDANTAVLGLLRSNPELVPIVEKYVSGAGKIDWTAELAAAGITDIDNGPITTLRVNEKLNGRERTLLDKLGYNNWRQLSPNSK